MVEVIFEVNLLKGLPQLTANTIPARTASPGAQFRAGAHAHGTTKNAVANRINTIFLNMTVPLSISTKKTISRWSFLHTGSNYFVFGTSLSSLM